MSYATPDDLRSQLGAPPRAADNPAYRAKMLHDLPPIQVADRVKCFVTHATAYVSDESGAPAVYVRPFPGPAARYLVSADGGSEPRWSPDGRRLFYRNGRKILAATVSTTPGFAVGGRRSSKAATRLARATGTTTSPPMAGSSSCCSATRTRKWWWSSTG